MYSILKPIKIYTQRAHAKTGTSERNKRNCAMEMENGSDEERIRQTKEKLERAKARPSKNE